MPQTNSLHISSLNYTPYYKETHIVCVCPHTHADAYPSITVCHAPMQCLHPERGHNISYKAHIPISASKSIPHLWRHSRVEAQNQARSPRTEPHPPHIPHRHIISTRTLRPQHPNKQVPDGFGINSSPAHPIIIPITPNHSQPMITRTRLFAHNQG